MAGRQCFCCGKALCCGSPGSSRSVKTRGQAPCCREESTVWHRKMRCVPYSDRCKFSDMETSRLTGSVRSAKMAMGPRKDDTRTSQGVDCRVVHWCRCFSCIWCVALKISSRPCTCESPGTIRWPGAARQCFQCCKVIYGGD